MRVLHVTEAYGGGLAQVINQYRTLPGVSHRLIARERRGLGVGAHSQGFDRILTSPAKWAYEVVRASSEADVLHLHSSVAGFIGRALPRRYWEKVVYTPHAFSFLGGSSLGPLYLAVERTLVDRTVAFGAVSRHEAMMIRSLGAHPDRVITVPHQISVPDEVRGRCQRALTVAAVGRVAPQKNPTLFGEVVRLSRLHPELREIEWLWIGDGHAGTVRELRSLGVTVTGWVPPEKVQQLISRSFAVLHTAKYEGLPMAVLEALATGTPVVGHSIDPIRELPCATFTAPGDALGLLIGLLDSGVWEMRSKHGVEYIADNFTATAQHRQLLDLYGRVTP